MQNYTVLEMLKLIQTIVVLWLITISNFPHTEANPISGI